MENRSLVTIAEHSREKILYMLEMAKQFEKNPNRRLLEGKVVATLIFDPTKFRNCCQSTRRTGNRIFGSQSHQFIQGGDSERYHYDGK